MNKQKIKDALLENHNSFIAFVNNLTNDEFTLGKNGKWTAGQQLEHILLSVKPFRQVLSLPKFMTNLIWGKANRKSRTYDELVNKYLQKLSAGGRATGRFIPKMVPVEDKKKLSVLLQNEITALSNKLNKFREDELDSLILPHPLLGKLTIREMLYFTIYHVAHHRKLTEQALR